MNDGSLKFPAPLEIAGLAAAFIPFVCSFSTSSSTTVNGRVVESTSTDYVAIVLGAVAILLGVMIAATLLPRASEDDRLKHIGVAVLVVAVGIFQVAVRGLGVV